MRGLPGALDHRVLRTDGLLVRRVRAHDLDLDRDPFGAHDCIEALNLTRAQLARDTHIAYLEAGADVIRTNTLEACPLSPARHDLGESVFDPLNVRAALFAIVASIDGTVVRSGPYSP